MSGSSHRLHVDDLVAHNESEPVSRETRAMVSDQKAKIDASGAEEGREARRTGRWIMREV